MKIPVLDISAIAVLLVLLAVLTSPVWLVFVYIAAIRDANT